MKKSKTYTENAAQKEAAAVSAAQAVEKTSPTIKIDPFDTTLLGKGILNFVLDPISCNAVAYPPLDTPENLEALNAAFKVTSQMDTQQKLTDDAWIQTYSGRKFYPLDPHIDSIVIQDIAHALAMQCRFTGHCKFHYSIAQHSVLVSYLVSDQDKLHALLHDASEAYVCDMASPLKRSGQFEEYKKIEKRLQNTIYRRFNLNEEEPKSVKTADLLMLSTEAQTLLAPIHPEWKLPVNPLPMLIAPISPEEAKKMFLDRFNELFAKTYII